MEQAKQYTEADVIRALREMSDRNIRVIKEPRSIERVEVDYEGFHSPMPNGQKMMRYELEDTVESCIEMLSSPTIADDFASHSERIDWANSMANIYGQAFTKFYMRNSLRFNQLNGVSGSLRTLGNGLRLYKVTGEKADAARNLADQLPDLSHYDTQDAAEKLEVVKKIEGICSAFLAIVKK